MPNAFAWLGFFEEANLQLYTAGTDDSPRFGGKDDGVVKITVRHGMIAGSYLKSSKRTCPFLFVYTESDGILMIVVGEKLDVEKDGIVG
jgi:hypothetical protein